VVKADQVLAHHSRLLADIEAGRYQLRFNLSHIKVADISSQYFCEKAVELDIIRGKPETEAVKTGTQGHEALTELAEKVPLERLVKNSLQKKSYTALNFPVWGRFRDVPILGRPDEVEFQNGSVTMVTENKFSSRLYPYNHYRVQAQLYCLLLESMGYDTSSTQYQIRIFQPRCSSCIELLTYRCPIFKPNRRSNHYECAYG